MVQAAEVVGVDVHEVVGVDVAAADVHEVVGVDVHEEVEVAEGNARSQHYWRRPCQALLVDV
uniref:Uncharacterized protein n=1 Tax=Salix viminalis TaxID=40686 RepID=A0A6N2MZD0_SALVM